MLLGLQMGGHLREDASMRVLLNTSKSARHHVLLRLTDEERSGSSSFVCVAWLLAVDEVEEVVVLLGLASI